MIRVNNDPLLIRYFCTLSPFQGCTLPSPFQGLTPLAIDCRPYRGSRTA